MTTVVLATAKSVTLDGTGAGSVAFTVPAWQTWTVARVTVTCSVTGDKLEASVYRRSVAPENLLTHTFVGGAATSDGNPETFHSGELVVIKWINGTAGATATANLGGTSELLAAT